jgi:hypothetical protein
MNTPTTDSVDESGQVEKEQPPVITRRAFRQMSAPKREGEDSSPEESPSFPFIDPATIEPKSRSARRFQFMPAFWTISSVISLAVIAILVVVVISLAGQLFNLKAVLKNQLVGGLATNFALMDQARIKTTINVSTKVPAKFVLPVETETIVTLTKDTTIKTARVTLSTGGLQISSAPTTIVLPAGTQLPVNLNIDVPVDEQIPVNLTVPVDIPLNQTDLHKALVGLQDVVRPYQALLDQTPGNWQELICGPAPSDFCKTLIP